MIQIQLLENTYEEMIMEKMEYKKHEKEIYLPKTTPTFIDVPAMNYIQVRGKGDPNEVNGQYAKAVELLYALSYTIKMSKMKGLQPEGFVDYTVYPLEGLWWFDVAKGVSQKDKSKYEWISMIRQPDFVTQETFEWACKEANTKKGLDTSPAKFVSYTEGKCVQCMHIGPYDTEEYTIGKMINFIVENNYEFDLDTPNRYHHEIYLSDPRKVAPEKNRVVVRYPIRKVED